jgi:hypothetical protein
LEHAVLSRDDTILRFYHTCVTCGGNGAVQGVITDRYF